MPQAAATQRKPPALPTVDKPHQRVPRIGKKLFQAIELMVFEGDELKEAADKAGLTTFALRQAFSRAHVLAHLRARREVLRAAASGKNIHRLCEIRDAADNMPAIQAIRTLEDMGDDRIPTGSGTTSSPGITIRILNVVQSAAPGDVVLSNSGLDESNIKVIDGKAT